MANFHSDEWIMARLAEHYEEALTMFPENRIVGVFYQGSANYGLDYEKSDVDTKCILVPTFEDIAFNRKPISTTHILDNNEHLDAKDIRLYINCFEKQNLNFLEILFTPYKIVNPQYAEWWNKLVENREAIAHYDAHRMFKSMRGIALEKYHAMEHKYPSKIEIIEKYGYDSKQLHHLLRIEDFLSRYIKGENYESCLLPSEGIADLLKKIKENNGYYSLSEAREVSDTALEHIEQMYQWALLQYPEGYKPEVEKLLKEVQYDIMKFAIAVELAEEEYYD